MDEFLTPRQLVDEFPAVAKSEGALAMDRLRKIGLPYYRLGRRRIVYKRSDVPALLERKRVLTADSIEA